MCVHRTPRIVPMTAYAPPSLLHQVWEYPLFEALYGRRSRRFGLGLAMAEGPFKYRSQRAPLPLSDVEEALLVAAGVGFSGIALWGPEPAAPIPCRRRPYFSKHVARPPYSTVLHLVASLPFHVRQRHDVAHQRYLTALLRAARAPG